MKSKIETLANVASILVALVAVWYVVARPPQVHATPPQETPLPKTPVAFDGATLRGTLSGGKAGIMVFSDFQCPFCAKFATETLPTLVDRYVSTGQAVLAFRNLPLESIHPFARGAAKAALCAAPMGLFWQTHDLLFQHQKDLNDRWFDTTLAASVPNRKAFNACRKGSEVDVLLKADMDLARGLGLNTTPTVLIGRVREPHSLEVTAIIKGARPFEDFANALKQVVK
jgi:protein-disulfide isomerase